MMSIKPLRTLGIISAAALISAATPAARRVPGYTFETVTAATTNNPNMPAGAGSFGMTTRSIVTASGASRMDVVSVEGVSQTYAIGDYVITKDGTMYLVHPATKTYVDVMAQVTGALASLPPQMLAQVMITDITGKSEKIGDETMEGRPTEHRRVTVSYAMGMMGQSIPTTITTDYWLAKLSAQIVNPLAPPKTEAMLATLGPMAELGRKQLELAPKPGDGVPMKFVVETAMSMMGRSMGTSITTNVKNLKESDVDASLIVVPADYTKAAK